MLRFIKQISALAIVLIALLEAPQETSASSFLPKSFDELVDGADQIVIGTVIGKRGRKLDNGAIVTDVNVSVLAVLKGAPVLRQLDLVVLGGAVGDERLEVAGFPEFIPGIKYFVFLKDNGSAIVPIVGGEQGMFQIRFNPEFGVEEMTDARGVTIQNVEGVVTAEAFTQAVRHRLGQ